MKREGEGEEENEERRKKKIEETGTKIKELEKGGEED